MADVWLTMLFGILGFFMRRWTCQSRRSSWG